MDELYDLHLYVELVRRALERYRQTQDIGPVWDIVVGNEQGRLFKNLLGYSRQDDETKQTIQQANAVFFEDLHYNVRVATDHMEDTYVVKKLSELAKLNIAVLKQVEKYR